MSKTMTYRALRRAMGFKRQVMMRLPADDISERMRSRMPHLLSLWLR